MRIVVWTDQALADLEDISLYIANSGRRRPIFHQAESRRRKPFGIRRSRTTRDPRHARTHLGQALSDQICGQVDHVEVITIRHSARRPDG
ncbi:hypothetical protein [Brevundimonas sp.]|uniref:hypothetical protein n=1 Tax=Brevundimonas sp. TaxID=1871086 RepID=UPI0025BDB1B0|nr:hypothetical protein [Brevundimonas sp.]